MTDRFFECLELFGLRSDFYKGIDIKIAAVQSDKTWFNLRAKILAIDHKTPTENEMPINLKGFKILHTRISADKFSQLLTDIKNGISEIGGITVNFFSEPFPSLNREEYCRARARKRGHVHVNSRCLIGS